VQRSAQFISRVDDSARWIFLIGLTESLNNIVAASGLVWVVSLITMIGGYRRACRLEAGDSGGLPATAG
jgi:hypothetical protein